MGTIFAVHVGGMELSLCRFLMVHASGIFSHVTGVQHIVALTQADTVSADLYTL